MKSNQRFDARIARGCSAMAFAIALLAHPAYAQTTAEPAPVAAPDAPAPASEKQTDNKDIIVTGSRLTKSGFTTPTPVTSASAETLKAAAPGNIADGLNQLPVFGGSTKANQTGGGTASDGNNGQNLLNLRNLGANRTLVMLDGRRIVATNQQGSVDVNVIPQSLVARVDVVTGGASAAYGSDAVAGVVNFVLDTKFKGLKGAVQGGISSYGDAGSFQGNLAFGKHLLDDRLHIIGSVEYARANGIGITSKTGRQWYDVPAGQYSNPTGTVPATIVVNDIRSSAGSYGGLITSGPLKGTQFLGNGLTGPFNYGTSTGTTFQSGGDGPKVNNGLSPDSQRFNAFAHVEFDASDAVTLFAEGSYSRSTSQQQAFVTQQIGSAGQFMIYRDNAYLPSSVASQMAALNLNTINVGRFFSDFPVVQNQNRTSVTRVSTGAKWQISSDWKADVSYTFGQTGQRLYQNNRTNLHNLYAAADAVVDPASGKIVCRSTLSGRDPGCVPLNIFGQGSPSAAAISYVLGNSGKDLTMTQHVAQFNIAGSLGDSFQLGAGPISLAAGFEYRHEGASQTSDAVSQSTVDFTGIRGAPASLQGRLGGYQSYNPQPMSGGYSVKDLYAEVGVPILKDKFLAKALDFNGAVRRTDYSQSGVVVTWKAGASWQIFDWIRLRYTRSRDIRGPNVLELFNPQTQNQQTVLYNGATVQDIVIISGNTGLKPEKADTDTFGFVFKPGFLPGFQMSVDRFNINVKDAIGTLSGQNTVNLCAAGNQLFCSQITQQAGGTLVIRQPTLNLAEARSAGYDFEAAYRKRMAGGDMQFRLLATHMTKSETQAIGSAAIPTLRLPLSPLWRFTGSLRYTNENWMLLAQERIIGQSLIDPTVVQGTGTSMNKIPAIAYTDLTVERKLRLGGGEQTLFLTVNNLFDQDPPISGGNPTSFSLPASQAYDLIGRYISAGIRFKM